MSFWHRIRSKTHAKIHENWRHFFFNLAHTLGRNGAKSKNFWRRVFRGHVRMLFRAKTDSSIGHAYGLQHNATNGTTLKPQKLEISDKNAFWLVLHSFCRATIARLSLPLPEHKNKKEILHDHTSLHR
ncbi:hypothetical protein [Porphyromonas loveana]|uniref:hypothetical protein n=1 Tax=Porphyromonas loveana TaxID=1884669 RepID=UPI0035A08E47